MRTPLEEREIQIGGYTYNQDGSRATTIEIYTSDYGYMAKLDRFCKDNPAEWRVKPGSIYKSGEEIVSKIYICPLSCILLREKTVRRNLTEDQREQMRIRMQNLKKSTSVPEQ